jgi:hypothetical protein
MGVLPTYLPNPGNFYDDYHFQEAPSITLVHGKQLTKVHCHDGCASFGAQNGVDRMKKSAVNSIRRWVRMVS